MFFMKPKKTLNLAIPQELLQEFNSVCAHYGHGKQKGMVLSAAILMFLRAEPDRQGEFLHQIMAADIAQGVKKMLAEKVAAAQQASLNKTELQATDNPPATESHLSPVPESHNMPAHMPRKAAKKAGKAVRGIQQLPTLEDFK